MITKHGRSHLGPSLSETEKALKNFFVTGVCVDLRLIKSLALVKSAAARTNSRMGRLDKRRAEIIALICKEIIAGKHDRLFRTDSIQGGAGTSINMNMNEVIAMLAKKRSGLTVSPLDHVNLSQSTNDVLPTAFRITILELIDEYLPSLLALESVFLKKAYENKDVLKVARTHLIDAAAITLGQEFSAYANLIKRNRLKLEKAKEMLLSTNLGGTAVGTGINSSLEYIKKVNVELKYLTEYEFIPGDNLIDLTQNLDDFLHVAYLLNLTSLSLSKISNDLRLMASGPFGEIKLPELQKGSTIMPSKVNPVILEMTNQVAYAVCGNTHTIELAINAGQLELNVMFPVIVKRLIESFNMLKKTTESLKLQVSEIITNKERCKINFERSNSLAYALLPLVGYDRTEAIINEAKRNNRSISEQIQQFMPLSAKEKKKMFDIERLTTPK